MGFKSDGIMDFLTQERLKAIEERLSDMWRYL